MSQRAAILGSALFVLVTMSTLVSTGCYFYFQYVNQIKNQIHYDRALNSLINQLIQSPPQLNVGAIGCKRDKIFVGDLNLSRTLCRQRATDNTLMNFSAVLPFLVNCSSPAAGREKTLTSLPLTLESVVSPFTCTQLPLPSSAGYFLEGNVDLQSKTQLGHHLFSSGYLSSYSDLTLTKDTQIIAGGDILLGSISCSASNCQLYLNSRSGSISYSQKSSNMTIYCEGKHVSCPGGVTGRSSNAPLFQQVNTQTLGIFE